MIFVREAGNRETQQTEQSQMSYKINKNKKGGNLQSYITPAFLHLNRVTAWMSCIGKFDYSKQIAKLT